MGPKIYSSYFNAILELGDVKSSWSLIFMDSKPKSEWEEYYTVKTGIIGYPLIPKS